MKALSIKRPWAPLIFYWKDIENRTWHLPSTFEIPQRVMIHIPSRDSSLDAMDHIMEMGVAPAVAMVCYSDRLWPKSAIVGEVTITGCVHQSDSPWFEGPHGLTLTDPVRYETAIPCKGALGFWTPPDDVIASIEEARLESARR